MTGLSGFWAQGDAITRSVAVLLLLMAILYRRTASETPRSRPVEVSAPFSR